MSGWVLDVVPVSHNAPELLLLLLLQLLASVSMQSGQRQVECTLRCGVVGCGRD